MHTIFEIFSNNPQKNMILRKIIILVAALLLACSFVQLFSHVSLKYDSFSFDLKLNLAPNGGSIVEVPPFGNLSAETHRTPLQIVFALNGIDFSRLEETLPSISSQQDFLDTIKTKLYEALLVLFATVLLSAFIGSWIALIIFRINHNDPLFLRTIIIVLSIFIILSLATAVSFDVSAFEHPRYQGSLQSAPWLMGIINMGIENVEIISKSIRSVSAELPLLYQQAINLEDISGLNPDLTVLHVSDIHNNPAAFEFIEQLTASFKVDFIIDTGDITDYGTALESPIINNIADLKLPYLFIAGNHDNPMIIKRLKQIKNVVIIDKKIVNQSGLNIVGISDPAATEYSSDVLDDAALGETRNELVALLEDTPKVPDILAVHNRKIIEPFVDYIPVILHGHDHSYKLQITDKSVISDAGSTGAAGLRGLTEKGVPYSASVLYWQKDEDSNLRLKAVDSIKIDGTQGKMTAERNVITQ